MVRGEVRRVHVPGHGDDVRRPGFAAGEAVEGPEALGLEGQVVKVESASSARGDPAPPQPRRQKASWRIQLKKVKNSKGLEAKGQ